MRRWRGVIEEKISAARRWLKFLVLGIIAFVICMLIFSPIMHVRGIRVIRTEGRVDIPAVLRALAPLYGRHLLFVSTHDVGKRVRESVPDANDVTVQKHYPSELLVRISVAPLVARVIIESPNAAEAGPVRGNALNGNEVNVGLPGSGALIGARTADFLTNDGLLVSIAHVSLSQPLPLIRIVDWGARPVPMVPLLAPAFLDRMRHAEDALTLEFGQQIRTRTVYLRAREFHLDSQTVSFWFDMQTQLADQLQRLRVLLANVKLQDVKSHIDLRLMGRVVYK